MAKRIKTPEQALKEVIEYMQSEFQRWEHIVEYGSSDPAWPDGVNLNLVKNHILHYKARIEHLCKEIGCDLPEEYYTPTPPAVDGNLFVKPDSSRAKRIKSRPGWKVANHGAVENPKGFNRNQGSLF